MLHPIKFTYSYSHPVSRPTLDNSYLERNTPERDKPFPERKAIAPSFSGELAEVELVAESGRKLEPQSLAILYRMVIRCGFGQLYGSGKLPATDSDESIIVDWTTGQDLHALVSLVSELSGVIDGQVEEWVWP